MSEVSYVTNYESATTAVVAAVSETTGVPADELPPLYEVVDPDALNGLVASTKPDRDSEILVTFDVADCTVTVSSRGSVRVTERDTSIEARTTSDGQLSSPEPASKPESASE